MANWQRVDEELRRWQTARLPVRLWLRDDDAVTATANLDRLAGLCNDFEIAFCLAAIPADVSGALGEWVQLQKNCLVAVHGYAHKNHAKRHQKKCELGTHRAPDRVLDQLSKGREIIRSTFGKRFFNCLVPPWNRIEPEIVAGLGDIGFEFLSTYGWKEPAIKRSSVRQINCHVDIIDWKGSRGGKNHDDLIGDLVNALASARQSNGAAIGVLTHHLVHDEKAWSFLQELFAFTCEHDNINWVAIDEAARNGAG